MSKAETAKIGPSSELARTMPKTVSRAGKLLALVCLPLVCAAVYYSPVLTSLGWHILHGKAIDYRGLHVEVPWGWTADLGLMKEDFAANPQGITLQKAPKTLSLESRGPEMIDVNLLLPDARSTPQQQAVEWKSLFIQSHPASNFDIAAPANAPAGTDCVEATPRSVASDAPAGAALACISLHGGWLANYAGSLANVPVFLKVIGDLKPQG